jgi:hypothetical protein
MRMFDNISENILRVNRPSFFPAALERRRKGSSPLVDVVRERVPPCPVPEISKIWKLNKFTRRQDQNSVTEYVFEMRTLRQTALVDSLLEAHHQRSKMYLSNELDSPLPSPRSSMLYRIASEGTYSNGLNALSPLLNGVDIVGLVDGTSSDLQGHDSVESGDKKYWQICYPKGRVQSFGKPVGSILPPQILDNAKKRCTQDPGSSQEFYLESLAELLSSRTDVDELLRNFQLMVKDSVSELKSVEGTSSITDVIRTMLESAHIRPQTKGSMDTGAMQFSVFSERWIGNAHVIKLIYDHANHAVLHSITICSLTATSLSALSPALWVPFWDILLDQFSTYISDVYAGKEPSALPSS